MQNADVISISRKRGFSLVEAREILPLIRHITDEVKFEVETLMTRLEALGNLETEPIRLIETEINQRIKAWHGKIRKLGGVPKGLWLVDFDSGDGYYCWKYPETEILYWHSYVDGFTKRVLVSSPTAHECEFHPREAQNTQP